MASTPFVFTPNTTSPSAASAATADAPSSPFSFGTNGPSAFTVASFAPADTSAGSAGTGATAGGGFEFNFDAPPPTGPLFTVGAAIVKEEEEETNKTRNPFANERRRNTKNEQTNDHAKDENDDDDDDGGEEDDENDEGEDAEDGDYDDDDEGDDGPYMDDDDEGDTPYPQHEKSASTVECDQCGEFIPRRELSKHTLRVCSETPMECPFVDLHCGATASNRRLLRAHVERNLGDHIVWMMAQLDEQRRQIQTLTDALHVETNRRQAIEHAIEEMGGKISTSVDVGSSRRGGGGGGKGGKGRGGPFSPSPSSGSPIPSRSVAGVDTPKFTISFDASKPLAQSDSRWVAHSIGAEQTPSKQLFSPPKSLAGTGNSASDEQTRLKIAAGLIMSPPKAQPNTNVTVGAPTAAPIVLDLPTLTKQLKSVLNKLTAANFEKLSSQVVSILKNVTDASALTSLVVLLFDKAVLDSYFSNIYSMLCVEISAHLPPIGGDKSNTFKRFLLNQCQVEFENGSGDLTRATEEDETTFVQRKVKQKQRMLGTIRFIGELYKKDLILHNIMSFCVSHLLPHIGWNAPPPVADVGVPFASDAGPSPAVEEHSDSIEAFCNLLLTIGLKFESVESGKKLFDDTVFPVVTRASVEKEMPSRLRFMLKDLIELRANRWRAREAATQAVAQEEKVRTTVEMGIGNGGVTVTGAHTSGRGAIHTHEAQQQGGGGRGPRTGGGSGSNSLHASPSIRPQHVHHDSHAHNSFFQSAQHDSARRGGGRHASVNKAPSRLGVGRRTGGPINMSADGDSPTVTGGDKWIRGDRLQQQGSTSKSRLGGNRR